MPSLTLSVNLMCLFCHFRWPCKAFGLLTDTEMCDSKKESIISGPRKALDQQTQTRNTVFLQIRAQTPSNCTPLPFCWKNNGRVKPAGVRNLPIPFLAIFFLTCYLHVDLFGGIRYLKESRGFGSKQQKMLWSKRYS